MKVYEKFTGVLTANDKLYTYEGCHRDWNPLPGHTPPTDSVWEIFTPKDDTIVCAAGGSKEEAVANLTNLIVRMDRYRMIEASIVTVLQDNAAMTFDDLFEKLMPKGIDSEDASFYLRMLVKRGIVTYTFGRYDLKR